MEKSSAQKALLVEFKKLFLFWNKTHNLIAKSQLSELDEHILDSLSVADLLRENILDMGSGGGLPGMPIAIKYPSKNIYLVESKQKKASFLLHAKNIMNLTNVTIIHSRVEDIEAQKLSSPLDIIARAFGNTESAVKASAHLLELPNTRLNLMKTVQKEPPENPPPGYETARLEKICRKEKDKQHILVTIEKKIRKIV